MLSLQRQLHVRAWGVGRVETITHQEGVAIHVILVVGRDARVPRRLSSRNKGVAGYG